MSATRPPEMLNIQRFALGDRHRRERARELPQREAVPPQHLDRQIVSGRIVAAPRGRAAERGDRERRREHHLADDRMRARADAREGLLARASRPELTAPRSSASMPEPSPRP